MTFDDFSGAAREGAPVPDNYEDLLLEFYNLRNQLTKANQKWAICFEKANLDRESAAGQIKALRDQNRHLKDAIRTFRANTHEDLTREL